MATKGRPIPFSLREEIKARRAEDTVRKVAQTLQVSKTTVQKYGHKYGTKP
jgi:response regulator of citrate/malate metabolism